MKLLPLALLLLGGCAVVPTEYEDDRAVITGGKVYVYTDGLTEAEIEETKLYYSKPVLDEAERKACRRVLWAQSADIATTVVGLAAGCHEANPLGGVVLIGKVWLMLACEEQAAKTPAAFSMASYSNWAAGVGAGAALWNASMVVSKACN